MWAHCAFPLLILHEIDLVSERAKQLLSANVRMRNALEEAAIRETETGGLDPVVKEAIDKEVEAHDPLKGISKSLLEKIRAKQVCYSFF